jgi:hypothetical protein
VSAAAGLLLLVVLSAGSTAVMGAGLPAPQLLCGAQSTEEMHLTKEDVGVKR